MNGKLVFFAVVLTGVLADPTPASARQGQSNKYYLYTRAHNDAQDYLELPAREDVLNPNIGTVIIVHGHEADAFSSLNPLVKNELFNEQVRGDAQFNVIVVDWSDYTKQSYSLASAAVPSVGRALGEYLQYLALVDATTQRAKISLDTLHLVGFHLGAHVVGFAGRTLNGRARRITGLDPAGSQWGSSSPRLSKSDARYVEVIHTDGNGVLSNGIGTATGHVDFFVNGGSNQPGCLTHACSHERAWRVFAGSLIREKPLLGRLCTSNLQMTLNLCTRDALPLGGDALWKRYDDNNSIYRVNTGRIYPY